MSNISKTVGLKYETRKHETKSLTFEMGSISLILR